MMYDVSDGNGGHVTDDDDGNGNDYVYHDGCKGDGSGIFLIYF